jgi:hypothetical protein
MATKKKKKPTTVVVLLYIHKHGTDCSVYTTMKLATEAAATIALDNLGDIDDAKLRRKLTRLYRDKKCEEFLRVWSEYQQSLMFNGEDFEFHEREIVG